MTNYRFSGIMYGYSENDRPAVALCRSKNEVILMPAPTNMKQTPVDYTGALSELLPQLIEKYTRDVVADYLNSCSEKLLEVEHNNDVLLATSIDERAQAGALKGLVAATGEYYTMLARLPEDIRRFLILMGGVTSNEISELLNAQPNVGDELSRLASVMPALQSIRPKNHVMQIDPISSKLAQLQEVNQVTVSRRRNLTIQTTVSLYCPEHMKIDGNFQLTNYDRSIINGVISILESGSNSFTVPMLYHAMTGKENPTLDDGLLEEIKQKLDTMRRLSINIDLTEEIKAHMIDRRYTDGEDKLQSFTIDSYLLPLNKYIGVVNGKKSEMYQIIDTPPLYSYAKMKNQISTVSIDLLKAPINNNATTIPLRTYLLGRIEAMKNQNNSIMRDIILFDAIYAELGDEHSDKKRKKRIRDYAAIILDHFIKLEYILQYEFIRDGRNIRGIRIYWQ
ncbi:MAG: hypothetical protein HFG20_05335 [Anaerotruncus sp.]|nr:hypothetical protein [Anaerotruncus sp.]